MINKFKNIKDYYTYLKEQKPISSENDPWGEEEWEDEVEIEVELDDELRNFIEFVSVRVRANSGFEFINDVNRNEIIRKNQDILLRFKEIMKYLDDNFYVKKKFDKNILKWTPKVDIEIHGDEDNPAHLYKKNISYEGCEDLGYILKEKLNLNIDEIAIYELEDYYVIDGFDIALYWIKKERNELYNYMKLMKDKYNIK